jgi:hypothetical protein
MALYADSPEFSSAPKRNFFLGSKPGFQNIPRFNQQQSGAFQDILSQGLGMLQNPGNSPLAQNARTQFHTQTVPNLAERFTALGGSGTKNSSGFQGALGSAAAGLEQGIAGMDFQNALQLLQAGLTPQYETTHMPGRGGFLQSLAGPFLSPFLEGGGYEPTNVQFSDILNMLAKFGSAGIL